MSKKSQSGVSKVLFTLENDEISKGFIKTLFTSGLIASAEMENSGFEREYLMFGQIHHDKTKLRVTLTTSDDRVDKLVDYINEHHPNQYDYPSNEIVVEPQSDGSEKYIAWVKA